MKQRKLPDKIFQNAFLGVGVLVLIPLMPFAIIGYFIRKLIKLDYI